MKSPAREPKPIDVSKLPERFRDEQPDPNAYQRFMRVLTGLVAVPKAEALRRDPFQKVQTAKGRKLPKTKRSK